MVFMPICMNLKDTVKFFIIFDIIYMFVKFKKLIKNKVIGSDDIAVVVVYDGCLVMDKTQHDIFKFEIIYKFKLFKKIENFF